MDESIRLIADITRLAEAAESAQYRDTDGHAVRCQPTKFPKPRQPSVAEEALRVRLEGLTRGEIADVQVAYLLGRDLHGKVSPEKLRDVAAQDPDHGVAYLMSKIGGLAVALRRGAAGS